ncbi:MAG: hypothetical protein ACLGGX_07085 [Bdellovibrionia bacterium]
MNLFKKSLLLMSLISSTASAYLDINESGELINEGAQRIGFSPQFLFGNGEGTNASLFFESGTSESTSTRIVLEGGDVNFNAFASLKYIPFPDVDQQPALGVRAGLGFARAGDMNNLYFQIAPLASKMVDVEFGVLTPYISLPIEFNSTKEENFMSNRFVFGTEFTSPETPQFKFGSEIGLELNKSFSYISLFITFDIERTIPFN